MTKAKRVKRWKPKEGELYWATAWCDGIISTARFRASLYDNGDWKVGNCFQTKREAEAVARKLNGFWKSVREGR